MKEPDRLTDSYTDRMHLILDGAWRLLKSRFLEERHAIATEAPFQHYFANIMSTLGDLHCTKRTDQFIVDLETKCLNIRNRTKYLDITCTFPQHDVSCAIELKFKTERQSAQDHGRIDAYLDIEAVEHACRQAGFSFGKFYMITNSQTYINSSTRGVGTIFPLHDGARVEGGEDRVSQSKGRAGITVTLSNDYELHWENIDGWYFLDVTVPPPEK